MKKQAPQTRGPMSGRLFQGTIAWTYGAIIISLLVCAAISWIDYRETQVRWQAISLLDNVRQARIDMSEGLLHVALSGDPSSPFNRAQGMALLSQAVSSLVDAVRITEQGKSPLITIENDNGIMAAIGNSVKSFRDQLEEWRAQANREPGLEMKLRKAFYELARQADHFDGQIFHDLREQSSALEHAFDVTLITAGLLLTGMCIMVFFLGRAHQETNFALMVGEQRLRTLVETIPDMVWLKDTNGFFLICNPTFERFFGAKEADIVGKTDYDFVDKDQANFFRENDQKAIASDGPSLSEEWLTFAETGYRGHFETIKTPTRDREGNLLGVLGISRDITERTRAQEAIRRSEERYRSLFENMLEGYVYGKMIFEDGRPQDFVYMDVNAAFEKMTGLKHVVGKKVSDVIPNLKDHDPMLLDLYGKVALSGEPTKTEMYVSSLGRWFAASVYSPEEGYFISVFDDITSRKQTELELTESREKFHRLVKLAPLPLALIDREGSVTYLNDRFQKLFGYSPEHVPTLDHWWNLACPHDPYRHWAVQTWNAAATRAAEKESDIHPMECEIACGNGEVRTVEISGIAMKEDFLAAFVDVTERKKMEEDLRREKDKLRNILDNMSDGVYMVNEFCEISYINPAIEEAFGPVNGRKCHDYFHDRNEPCPWCKSPKIFAGESIWWEWHSDKTGRTYELYERPIKNDDGSSAKLEILHDVTDRKLAEQALRESEERFSKSFKNNPAWLSIMHTETNKILEVNDAWTRVMGYTPEEAIGRTPVDLSLYDEAALRKIVEEAKAAGSIPNMEETVENRAGEKRVLLVSRETIEIGGESFLLAMGLDITDRKKAEAALQESEQRYRAIFNIASVGIKLMDQEGKFFEVNTALSKFLGYTPEEFHHLTIFDVTHPEDVERSRKFHNAMVQGKTEGYRLEKRYVQKDGTLVWGDTGVSAIRDADGRYKATVGAIRDVTQHKKSEAARILLEAAVEQAVETVEITDPRGVIVYVNPAFERTTGHSREEVLGKTSRFLRTVHDDDETTRAMWDSVKKGNIWTGHLINKKKDGTLLEEDVSISPVKDSTGKILNYVAVKRDVTAEVSLQKQLFRAQKLEAIGTLAGGVAHDFNNILQVALGYSELILGNEELAADHRSDLQKIHEAATRGADLVQRLLTFSRKTEIKPQPLDLNRHITEFRKMIERTIPKMIRIELSLEENLARINADPTQIDQVLMNLAVNARDAMPEGGTLTIETANIDLDEEYVRTQLEAKPGPHVLLMVTDTGQGLDKETLEHVFEPFFTTKSPAEGTGLGLAMVHGIVKLHGGHVKCYSEPGQGAAFKIYLPALVAEEDVVKTTRRPMPQGGTETILLVDDDEHIRELGSRILSRAGYKVLMAVNGKEALQVYQDYADEIALVILDLIMPVMGGKQCLEALLELNPSIKIAIASGYSADGPTREAIARGVKGFVNKPYHIHQVLDVVRSILDSD